MQFLLSLFSTQEICCWVDYFNNFRLSSLFWPLLQRSILSNTFILPLVHCLKKLILPRDTVKLLGNENTLQAYYNFVITKFPSVFMAPLHSLFVCNYATNAEALAVAAGPTTLAIQARFLQSGTSKVQRRPRMKDRIFDRSTHADLPFLAEAQVSL